MGVSELKFLHLFKSSTTAAAAAGLAKIQGVFISHSQQQVRLS